MKATPILVLLLLVSLFATITATPGRGDERAEALTERIDSLRATGDHPAALEDARVLHAYLQETEAKAYALGDAARLVTLLETVLEMPEDQRARFVRADSLRGASDDAYNNEDMEAAAAIVREELALRSGVLGDMHPEVGRTWRDLGYCLSGADDLEGSVAAFQQALEVDHTTLGTHPMVAEDLNMLGLDVGALGKLPEAAAFFRDALRVLERTEGPGGPEYLYALDNLADVHRASARLADAEAAYRTVAAGYRELYGDGPEVGSVLNRLAGTIVERGDPDRAVALYRESYAMFEEAYGAEDLFVADILNNLGEALTDLKYYTPAERSYTRAIEIYAANEDEATRSVAMHNLADLYHEQGLYDRAEPLYREALTIAGDYYDADDPVITRMTVSLARDLREQTRFDEAEALYASALAVGEAMSRNDLTRCLYSYARCLVAKGDLVGGERVLLEAVPAYEQVRANAGDGYSRAAFQNSPYPPLAAIRLEHGEEQEAWVDVERDMGRVLVELLIYAGREEEAEPYDLADVQRSLGEREAIIGWLDVPVRTGTWASWVYVIRENGPVLWGRCEVGANPFEASRAYVDAISSTIAESEWKATARALWEERFAPVTDALDEIRRLVVIPSGAMLGVPVETLIDPDVGLLADRYRISYAPSATTAAWLAYREARGVQRALVLGDPPFDVSHVDGAGGDAGVDDRRQAGKGLARLEGTRREATAIAAMFESSELLLGTDASEQRIAELAESGDLASFDVIHLATHGLVNDRRPDESALVLSQVGLPDPVQASLSGERQYDGLITAGEIASEWRLGAGLVVLSACETGLGRRVGGEGYVGLSQALLQAGARNVVVSLWKVEDRATALLMESFYRELTGGVALSDALTVAKHELRTFQENGTTPYDRPAFWSAFVLIGSGE